MADKKESQDIVFDCSWGNSLKSLLSRKRNEEKLRIIIRPSESKIFGHGYIANEDGKNEYQSDFEYGLKDVLKVDKGEFQGTDALVIETRLQTLYGMKKTRTMLPGCVKIDEAVSVITNYATEAGGMGQDKKATASPKATVKEAPQPQSPATSSPAPTTPVPVMPTAPAATPVASTPAPSAPTPTVAAAPTPSVTPAAAVATAPTPSVTPAAAVRPHPTTPVPSYTPSPAAAAAAMTPTPRAAATISTPPTATYQKSKESLEDKLKRLEISHDMGMCSDDEYKIKKLKAICEDRGLDSFYEKIQRTFVGRDSGLMSNEEYQATKDNIVNECFDPNVTDLNVFRENTAKIPIIEMSDLLTPQEFSMKKDSLLASVTLEPGDSNDDFVLKLRKLTILAESGMVSREECESDKLELQNQMKPSARDSIEALDLKLSRWPAMVAAEWATAEEYAARQAEMVESVRLLPQATENELRNKIAHFMQLKEKGWMDETIYRSHKLEILKELEKLEDQTLRMQMFHITLEGGLISDADYEQRREGLIKEIFAPYNGDMAAFKEKVNLLMNLHKGGIISDPEFNTYRDRLMG